jgi:hypothetical protein
MKFLNWLGNKVCLSFSAIREICPVGYFGSICAIHGVPLSHAVNKPEKQMAALNPLRLPRCAARVKPNLQAGVDL